MASKKRELSLKDRHWNKVRAGRIAKVIDLYRKLSYRGCIYAEPDETVVKDLLCDLGHFCDSSRDMQGETLFECWGSASINYSAETNDTGKQFEVI